MKLTKTLLFVVAVLAGSLGLHAQDLHNSLFYMNPLHMNPGFSGAFEGTYRAGGIYRDQARSAIGSAAYSTPAFFVDIPIIMIGKRNWLGGGVLVFQDQAGSIDLKNTGIQFSAAFHYSMDKKSKNMLSIGAQYGIMSRSKGDNFCDDESINLNGDITRCEDITQNADVDNLLSSDGSNDPSYKDINAGVLLKSKVNKKTDFNMGLSVRHIGSPSAYNFGDAGDDDIDLRLIAHAQLTNKINDKWSITPELYFTNIGPSSQFQVHGWAGYMLKPEKNIRLNMGLGYRSSDAGQVLLGIDYGDVKAAIAYDLTLSDMNNLNSYQGGFELSVYYIGKIFKKPDVKPAILCPHL